ncbi:class I SAM-dependent DNA methyltransferase, partial [Ramlibacter sp. AN1133]|uniref:class I SAM-dependent DNA methyltransferase n=1 Tax=Ramlibacter sp. AN1133 TaxID=3133429 RepID=UPI0030C4543E
FKKKTEQPSRSAREAFGGLSDAKWLRVLKRSIKEPVIDGVRMPGFPPAELQSHTVGSAFDRALVEASNFYSYAKQACAKHGTPIEPGAQILDFGVSWGRIIRFFMKDVEPSSLHGVDISTDYLDAARQTGVPGHLHRIDPLGRLPYEDRAFDLVYAYSVFTHLPENVQDHWLPEIACSLKPGGLLVATVEPPRFIDHFLPLDPDDKSLHPWHAATARKIRADVGIKERLQQQGFVYIPDRDGVNEVYGDCAMTPGYVREHWGRYLEVLDFLDDADRFWQAVVVARKRK